MPMPGEQQRREKEKQDAYQRAKEHHYKWLKSDSEKMWAETAKRNAAFEKGLREKDYGNVGGSGGVARGGGFGRLLAYGVLVIIGLAVYRELHYPDEQRPSRTESTAASGPDQQGPANTESTAASRLALTSQTTSLLSHDMLICEGSGYGCSVGDRFIAAHRYQVLKCVYGGSYYLFWKDDAPPGWDRFINGHAFEYFGKSALPQCPTNSTEALRVF